MSAYVWRVHWIVAADQVKAAAEVAARVLPGGEAERAMFGVALLDADAGRAEPGFLACSTLLTDAQFEALKSALTDAGVRSRWTRVRAEDERRVDGMAGNASGPDGRWSWEDSLRAAHCVAATEVEDG
jgi:hypothetical protein